MNLFRFIPGYDTHIYGGAREPAFLMLVAFILTLAGTRFYTRMARVRGWGSAHVGEVHVHHLVPGIVLSLVAGGLAIGVAPHELGLAVLAIVFGAGAALVLDEFAMLLHLDDVYWTTEGRLSIDACLAAVAFLGLAVLATFPLPTDHGSERLAREIGDGLIVLAAVLVVVTLLKGKLKLGLFGDRLRAVLRRRSRPPGEAGLDLGAPAVSAGQREAATERSPRQVSRRALVATPRPLLRPDRRRAAPRLEGGTGDVRAAASGTASSGT